LGLVTEGLGRRAPSLPGGITFGDPFPTEGQPRQIKGTPGGPGLFKFLLSDGELWRGLNTPYKESDLAKVPEDLLKKRFGNPELKVVEYREGRLKDLKGGNRELWPPFLILLLAVLVVEMIVANGIPWYRGTKER